MRKVFKAAAALGLVAMMSAPAMAASVDMTGFYRVKGYVTNFFTGAGGDWTHQTKSTSAAGVTLKKDAPTASYVDQRFRGKISVGEENVKAVLHLESEGTFGGTNADLSGDSTSALKVKNLYLWFKVPDTSVDVTAGLQSIGDPYAGVFMGAADVAGVFVNAKPAENLGLRLGWALPYQPSLQKSESTTLYVAEAKLAPVKDVKVGVNLYFLQDRGTDYFKPFDTNKVWDSTSDMWDDTDVEALGLNLGGRTNIYMPGVDFAAKAGPVDLSGFVFTQFGDRKFDNTSIQKLKFRSYAADLRVDAAAGPAKVFLEGLYTTGTGENDTKYKGVVVLDDFDFGSGSSTYNRNGMVLLTPDADAITTAGALTYDMNNHGLGITHVAAGAKMEVAPKTTAKIGLGYLRSTKPAEQGGSKNMGTEVNLMVNYNLMKGLDLSGTAAYAWLGGYFTDAQHGVIAADLPVGQKDIDDPYALIARINYAY